MQTDNDNFKSFYKIKAETLTTNVDQHFKIFNRNVHSVN